jgi:hypothetical protein
MEPRLSNGLTDAVWVGAARAKNELWSSTHPLPNADAAVKPVPGTRPAFSPLERHYRIAEHLDVSLLTIQEESLFFQEMCKESAISPTNTINHENSFPRRGFDGCCDSGC